MQNKTFCFFGFENRRKCIANLHTQSMHFSEDFAKYKTQKVMKEIVHLYYKLLFFNKYCKKSNKNNHRFKQETFII